MKRSKVKTETTYNEVFGDWTIQLHNGLKDILANTNYNMDQIYKILELNNDTLEDLKNKLDGPYTVEIDEENKWFIYLSECPIKGCLHGKRYFNEEPLAYRMANAHNMLFNKRVSAICKDCWRNGYVESKDLEHSSIKSKEKYTQMLNENKSVFTEKVV